MNVDIRVDYSHQLRALIPIAFELLDSHILASCKAAIQLIREWIERLPEEINWNGLTSDLLKAFDNNSFHPNDGVQDIQKLISYLIGDKKIILSNTQCLKLKIDNHELIQAIFGCQDLRAAEIDINSTE